MEQKESNEGCWKGVKHRYLLFGAGTIVAILIYVLFPITYFPDSDQYYNFGKTMLGDTTGSTSNFRGAGIPLMLVLSGVYLIGTFKLFVALQLLMGVLLPLLLYNLLSHWNKRIAFWTSLLSVVSIIPFGYAKAILSEQVYMFVMLLLVNNSFSLLQTRVARYLYFQAFFLFLLVLLKPIANLLFLVFIAFNLFVFGKQLKHVGLSFLLYFVLIFLSAQYNTYLFRDAQQHELRQSMAGSILFYNLYLSSDIEGRSCNLHEIERLEELSSAIARYYLSHPEEYARWIEEQRSNPEVYRLLYKAYANNPIGLSRAVIEKPTKYYYSFLYENANKVLGNEAGDRMMLEAAREMIEKFPGLAISYSFRNLAAFATGKHIAYSYYVARDKRITEYFPPSLEPLTWPIVAAPSAMDESLQEELHIGKVNTNDRLSMVRNIVLVEIWGRLFRLVKPLVFLGMLAALFLYRDNKYYVLLLAAAIVFYHMAIVCIFNVPLNRYVIPTFLLEVFCAAVFMNFVIGKLKHTGANPV